MKSILIPSSTSNVIRVKLLDSTSTVGAGKTGLTSSSGGLLISTICDNEASATVYSAAGSTTETITTLGTFAAPTATKCRFKEVDATNHPGIYEIQIANARFAVSGARSMIISVSATGVVQYDCEIIFGGLLPTAAATNLYNAYSGTGYGDGTAQAGASGSITLAAGETATNDLIVPCVVTILSGTGAGQSRYGYAYNGTTKVLSVRPNWVTAPDNTSVYLKSPFPDIFRAIMIESNNNVTAQQALCSMLAVLCGKWNAPGDFYDPSGTNLRVSATVDGSAPYRNTISLTSSS